MGAGFVNVALGSELLVAAVGEFSHMYERGALPGVAFVVDDFALLSG